MDSRDQKFLRFHQEALGQGKILIQQCKECGQHVFYPRALCNHCDSEDLKWIEALGRGHICAFPEDGGVEFEIQLEEGPRLKAAVFDLEIDEVTLGMEVAAHIVLREGEAVVAFSSKVEEEDEW